MFNVKNIKTGTFADNYQSNIQLQFNGDANFVAFMQTLANEGIDYQNKLVEFGNLFNLNNPDIVNQPFVLDAIGYILGIPPISAFPTLTASDYLLIIKGKQAQNLYDGTNISMLNLLNSLFEGKFRFFIQDTGNMSISIFLIPITTISPTEQQLFEDGYFTPKPAGVSVNLTVADKAFFSWDNDYVAGPPQLAGWETGVWV